MAALDGPQASWAGGQLFPDPENDPRCEHVGSEGGVDEYRCETRTTPLTRNDDDIWYICRYRVRVYNNGHQIVITFDLLRCWTSDPGEGGEEEASLTLDCGGGPERDKPAIRGSEVNCAVSLEGGNEDASGTVFEWESEHATWSDSSGTGGSNWGGVATETTDITVTVITGDEVKDTLSETVTVSVEPRTWTFDALSAPAPIHSDSPGKSAKAWGGYETDISERGGVAEGTGPWAGRFYMAAPPGLSGTMYLHSDFTTTGNAESTAVGDACSAVRTRHIKANVYQVNDLCGDLANLAEWEDSVTVHEQKHEDSANKCLASSTAENVLADLEKITGGNNGIILTYNRRFTDFYDGPFDKAKESDTATPRSPEIWEWRDHHQWTEQALDPFQHTGRDGC